MTVTPEHLWSAACGAHAPRELDAILDRFSRRLDVDMPAVVGPRTLAAEREWADGIDAERVRGLALLTDVRAAAYRPGVEGVATATILHLGIRSCLDSAERWRGYYGHARDAPGRFALLARAEVASLLARELRELADRSPELAA
jgi:hypothetical protein